MRVEKMQEEQEIEVLMIMMKRVSVFFLSCVMVSWIQIMLSIRDREWTQYNKKNAPIAMPSKRNRQKLCQSIAVESEQRKNRTKVQRETGYLFHIKSKLSP
jgi:hypothetical protein